LAGVETDHTFAIEQVSLEKQRDGLSEAWVARIKSEAGY
jgi:LPS sulfotransferase NodH